MSHVEIGRLNTVPNTTISLVDVPLHRPLHRPQAYVTFNSGTEVKTGPLSTSEMSAWILCLTQKLVALKIWWFVIILSNGDSSRHLSCLDSTRKCPISALLLVENQHLRIEYQCPPHRKNTHTIPVAVW